MRKGRASKGRPVEVVLPSVSPNLILASLFILVTFPIAAIGYHKKITLMEQNVYLTHCFKLQSLIVENLRQQKQGRWLYYLAVQNRG